MNNLVAPKLNTTDRKTGLTLLMVVSALVLLVVAQDFLRANVNGSAFYFSESITFSAFWWLFVPLLLAQYTLVRHRPAKRLHFYVAVITVPFGVHLLAFPGLVWIISRTFHEHTFAYGQTLRYALAEHVYQLVILYAMPVVGYSFFTKTSVVEKVAETDATTTADQFLNTLLVSEGGRKFTVPVQDIVYFSAEPPYIGIHTAEKKYLYPETLKAIATKLPPQHFVRVHKSTIVNINRVEAYSSRLNGDYDLILKNKGKFRVSRNFAADFKHRFQAGHHLTA